MVALPGFPTMAQLESDPDTHAPVEWHPPTWEWVDPTNEQQASENSIKANQSTYQNENGKRGQNYLATFKQRAKEEKQREELGLLTVEEQKAKAELMKAEAALITAKAAEKNAETNAEAVTTESSNV